MAITEDMDFPRLTPPDDRMPSGRRLFRRPAELTDEQFDLMAAAWAEGALSGEAVEELESVMTASTDRRDRAGSFRSIRLVPYNENWPGMKSAVRLSPALTAFRRSVIPTLLAVAAMVIMIIYGPAGAKLKTINSRGAVNGPAMTVAEIQVYAPIIAVERIPEPNILPVRPVQTPAAEENASQGHLAEGMEKPAEITGLVRVEPIALARGHATASSVAPELIPAIISVNIRDIQPDMTLQEEKNWMFRSISFLAGAVTGKEKKIDGYMIANGCISGINSILGWKMELQQVNNSKGDPVAVNFSSSLLSFTKPLNKITP